MYCNILITKPFNQCFTYKAKINQKVKLGSVVKVSFGKIKEQIGIIYDFQQSIDKDVNQFQIKEIDSVYENLYLNKKIIKLIDWIAEYTLAPKGLVLKLFLINKKIISHKFIHEQIIFTKTKVTELNQEQQKAYNFINNSILKNSEPIVLDGVTGSGKTEVYFKIIEKILLDKKQTLIMLPEISLTPQLEIRFKERFGFVPDVWHSKISEKKRKNIWHRCYLGKPTIVIGARSSLFLPFKNLGLIVVDEEHDISYKQEENIRYQARDLAIVRAKIEKFPIILASATPSLETYNNVIKKKFVKVNLNYQYSGLDLPKIHLIDLKKEKLDKNKWISKKIFSELKNCMNKGEQALLFLNRRGYSPLSLCSDCGFRFQCKQCSSWLVMHKRKNRLQCHHCGTIYPKTPTCPKCKNSESIKLIGPGVERLAQEVKEILPKYKTDIMSSDNANTPDKVRKIIDDFSSKKINILVATQIMAKGYLFPNLSFVGIIDADSGLLGGDIRAIERTFNLLQQVSGRAGRSKQKGKVFIQTYYPEQPIMQSIRNRDREKFISQSLLDREKFNVPPFSFMTAIIVSSHSKSDAESYSYNLLKASKFNNKINILGPVEAPLFLLRGQYRYRLLIKSYSRRKLNDFTKNLLNKCPVPNNLRLTIDVDPYSFV